MDTKKLLIIVGVLFVGFWMFTDPNGLADLTKSGSGNGWDLVKDIFENVIDFINELV